MEFYYKVVWFELDFRLKLACLASARKISMPHTRLLITICQLTIFFSTCDHVFATHMQVRRRRPHDVLWVPQHGRPHSHVLLLLSRRLWAPVSKVSLVEEVRRRGCSLKDPAKYGLPTSSWSVVESCWSKLPEKGGGRARRGGCGLLGKLPSTPVRILFHCDRHCLA